jgi:uncharacterized protein DUF6600
MIYCQLEGIGIMKNFKRLQQRYHLAIAILAIIFTNYATAEAVREFTPRTARISYLEGSVTTQRTADEDWTDAALNLPLMVGDKIYTGVNGRVELQLEDEVVLRLGGDTYVHFANLEETLTRIGVLKGTMAVNARAVTYARTPIEVQANGFLSITNDWSKTRYNIGEEGVSEILVRRGLLNVAQGDSIEHLQRGDQVRITGPDARAFEKINQEDGFDQWCDLRNAMQAASVSRNHISSRVAGYSDLDRHGEWVDIPKYGTVWRPTVVVKEWAPYRDGRWVWYDSCGWTWVSHEPWGWAPYHYGRWVYVKNYNWCWTPHTEIVHVVHHPIRPIWHPALVSFTYARKGSYFNLSIGGRRSHWNDPCIGWFALGPRDPYIPWHRRHGGGHGRGGGNNIIRGHGNKIENNTYITNNTYIYQNQDAPNSVTVVKENEFASKTPGTRAIAQIKPSRGKEVIVGSAAIQRVEQKRLTPTRAKRAAGSAEDYKLAVKASNNTATSTPRAARPTKDSQARRPETVATSNSKRTTTTAARTEPSRTASSKVRSETARRAKSNATAAQRTSPQRNERNTQTATQARSNTETRRTPTTRTAPTSTAKTTERRSVISERPTSQSAKTQTTRQTSSPARTSTSRTTTQPRTTQPTRTQTSASRERIMTTHPAREATSPQSSSSYKRQSVTTPTRDSYRQSTTAPQRSNYRQSATTPQRSSYSQSSANTPQRSYSQTRTTPGNSSGATYQSSAPRTSSSQKYSAPKSSSNQRSSTTSQPRSSTRSNSRTSSKRR